METETVVKGRNSPDTTNGELLDGKTATRY